jgi:hypothetical protein
MERFLWDLIESEAHARFFIDSADEPAFLICRGPFAIRGPYGLYLNTVGHIASFPSAKKAELRLQEIVKTARTPVKVFKQTRRGRILFAENTETRIPPNAIEGTMMATFTIPEWKSEVA